MVYNTIRIVFWEEGNSELPRRVKDIVEMSITTRPGKQPAWFRTVVSLLKMSTKWNDMEKVKDISIEFRKE